MLARKRDSKVTARFKKGRLRIAVACCVACSTWLASSSSIFSQQKKSVVYRGIVAIDDAQFSDGKLCVPLQVAMTSDDFFQGLRASAGLGRRFYKHGAPITEFPAQTTIFVRASMLGCSQFPYIPVTSDDARDFMGNLNFTLEWESPDLQRKPVEGFGVKLAPPLPSVWPENDKPIRVWSYILNVTTKGVPLADELIITIYSETSKQVSRMAVRL
jgi:hypothetical protein